MSSSNSFCLKSWKGILKNSHCCSERVEDLDFDGVVNLDSKSCLSSDDSASLGCDAKQFTPSYQLHCCSKRVGDLDPVVCLSFLEGTLTGPQQFASCDVAVTLSKWLFKVFPACIKEAGRPMYPSRGFRTPGTGTWIPDSNRPFPRSKNPHFKNEARCTTFLVKMSFICMKMKNDFHIKG